MEINFSRKPKENMKEKKRKTYNLRQRVKILRGSLRGG